MADPPAFRARFAVTAAWPVAVLLAALSFAGLSTSAYARETPAWIAQAIGQDWFDLAIAAPLVAACGIAARRSRTWRVLLAGAYAYTVYELVIYAFAIHFNALFLVYCATLGLALFALISTLSVLADDVPAIERHAAHLGGGFLIGVGAIFALLWLAEDIPAVLNNTPSRELVDTGLYTNPVHVIDLSFVLPAHVVAGVWLARGRRAGALYGPVILAFGVLMSASIGAMLVVIALHGGASPIPVIAAMFAIASASAGVLARVLRPQRERGSARPISATR